MCIPAGFPEAWFKGIGREYTQFQALFGVGSCGMALKKMKFIIPVVITGLQLMLIVNLKFLDAFSEIVLSIVLSIGLGLYLRRNTEYRVLGNGFIISGTISVLYTAVLLIWITVHWKG